MICINVIYKDNIVDPVKRVETLEQLNTTCRVLMTNACNLMTAYIENLSDEDLLIFEQKFDDNHRALLLTHLQQSLQKTT